MINKVFINAIACHKDGASMRKINVDINAGDGKVKIFGTMDSTISESVIAAILSLKYCNIITAQYLAAYDFIVTLPIKPVVGSSFGLPIFMALYCAIKSIKPNKDIAYTGKLDDKGNVLAVDGINAKLIAAKDAKLKSIMLPLANFNEVDEIYPLYVHPVSHIEQAIKVLI